MDASKLTQQLSEFAGAGATRLGQDEKRVLMEACAKLQAALEDPIQKLIKLIFTIYDAVVLRVGLDMKLVDVAVGHNGSISVQELATAVKSDAEFVRRVSRTLITLGVFTETAKDTYAVTPLASILVTGSSARESIIHITGAYPAVANLPIYFEKNGYKSPSDAFNGPWQFAHNAGEGYFDWLERPENATQQYAFNATMAMQKNRREGTWCEFYPGDERLRIEDPERVLFVDVGGGMGHAVQRFHERFPSLPGKLVLTDLPSVIEAVRDLPEAIIRQPHNFFTPFPDLAKGAKAFYLKVVLHDWPHEQARTILNHVHDAMAKDSVLLIQERILPDIGVPALQAQMDWHMMATLSSLERTEEYWRRLLEETGLEMVKIWEIQRGMETQFGNQCLIEAKKKA